MSDVRATVIAVKGESIVVRGQRLAGCASCSRQTHCASAQRSSSQAITMTVANPGKVSVGQQVTLSCDDNTFLKAIAVLFGVPLIGLISGPMFALLFWPDQTELPNSYALISMFCGCLLGAAISRRLSQKLMLKEPDISLISSS